MRSWCLLVSCVAIVTLAGCRPGQRTPVATAASPQALDAVRSEILRADPLAIVGVVTQVLPRDRFAAVGDVPLHEFRLGEPITFIDASQKRLAHGVVRRITPSELHVQYEPPPRTGRAPRPGDLAVRFKM